MLREEHRRPSNEDRGVSEPAQAEQETAGREKLTAYLIAGGATVPLCTQNLVNSTEAPAC